ncbi:MAG: sulfatase-like hydrolase/transferase [Pyrinomonadaceae bacterium]
MYGVFANAKNQGNLNPYKYNNASNEWEILGSTGGRAYAANNVTLYMIMGSMVYEFFGPDSLGGISSDAQNPGPKQLVAGGDSLYCVFGDDHIYRYEGITKWTQVGGPGFMFAANNKDVFSISPNQQSIYKYSGTGTEWVEISGPANVFPAKHLVAGGDSLYCVFGNDDIYRYEGTPGQWTRVGGPGFMFAANDKDLFGISPDQQEVRQYQATNDSWSKIGGPASYIAAGGDSLYEISGGEVYKFTGRQPNIIMILVDQMRFPMHFPPGISNADKFIDKYMPNLYGYIWKKGVRFANHYTAASDCTAGRATIYTGLYGYQTYLMLTLITYPDSSKPTLLQPELQPEFPTVGKLLREAGYETPYFGKWHMSYYTSSESAPQPYPDLEPYGFDLYTVPDLPGLQGEGAKNDMDIATDAVAWVNDRASSGNTKPFFLTVGFENPHDKQFFWGGWEVEQWNSVYGSAAKNPAYENAAPAQDYTTIPTEQGPPSYGYPTDITEAIPNWENQSQLSTKPSAHTLVKEVFQYQMGGVYETADTPPCVVDTSLEPFCYQDSKVRQGAPTAMAPYEYWSKSLDAYIQVMQLVDEAIGKFMDGVPEEIMENTVFVFTSDHGEYASSHGLLQGKGSTIYEEGILIPLVVYDPSGRFTASTDQYRKQLTSSVDLLPMMVSMGYSGSSEWMHGDYQQLYGNRCDLLSILKEQDAPGRSYVLHSTDEFVTSKTNYLDAPMHVIGMITMDEQGHKQKLGMYTTWEEYAPGQSQAIVRNDATDETITQLEYYDHSTEDGANETSSTPNSQQAQEAMNQLWGSYPGSPSLMRDELQAPLPSQYQAAQQRAYQQLCTYMNKLEAMAQDDSGDSSTKEQVAEYVTHVLSY